MRSRPIPFCLPSRHRIRVQAYRINVRGYQANLQKKPKRRRASEAYPLIPPCPAAGGKSGRDWTSRAPHFGQRQ